MKKYSWLLGLLVVLVIGGVIFKHLNTQTTTSDSSKSTSSKPTSATSQSDLPAASASDWNLLVVNRDHPHDELNPTLTTVAGVQVDQRIANATTEFLAAAQKVDSAEHLISGYRPVAYQTQLYDRYVDQEMAGAAGTVNAGGGSITRAQAEKNVQTYSQPPKMSEHQTGLAIDISTVDSLNESPKAVVKQIAALAPKYGFILRFPADGKKSTGVGYEDWHYRYVGVANAEYITKHNLTLEEYVAMLDK